MLASPTSGLRLQLDYSSVARWAGQGGRGLAPFLYAILQHLAGVNRRRTKCAGAERGCHARRKQVCAALGRPAKKLTPCLSRALPCRACHCCSCWEVQAGSRAPAIGTHPDDLPRIAAAIATFASNLQQPQLLYPCAAEASTSWAGAAASGAGAAAAAAAGTCHAYVECMLVPAAGAFCQ